MDARYPIPGRLNTWLVLGVSTVMLLALVHLGTSSGFGPGYVLATAVYALAFLCNYSLLHEACHDKLHRHAAANRFLGTLAAMLFPISFSLIHATHQGHHIRNRSDDEMFDLYYEGEPALPKRVRWYVLLLGGHYFAMVLASFAVLLLPSGVLRKALSRNPSYGPYVEELLAPDNVIRIRWESVLIVLGLVMAVSFLDIPRLLPAVLSGIFLWSTNQYLTHVFSPRDRVEGAYNLTGAGFLSWILLHREHDLTHHRRPDLPWIYLRAERRNSDLKINYYYQWLRQWSAPRRIKDSKR